MHRPMRLLAIPGLVLALAGCASSAPVGSSRAPAPERRADAGPALDDRALLLMLTDRRLYEPRTLEAMLAGPPETRRALAVALGRLGDARGRSLLQGLLVDSDVETRRAAAFALGELGVDEARRALLVAAVDDDPQVGALAVEALGKSGASLGEVRRVLGAIDPDEAWRRLAPFLFRFPGDDLVAAAREAVASQDPVVHRGGAYALGREARPEGREALLGLLSDPDPFVRAIAARGVGRVGELSDLAALRPLADDREISPQVQVWRAVAAILARVEALPPLAWGDAAVAALRDPEPQVRAATLEAAGELLPHPELEQALRGRWREGEPRERELALAALVAGRVDGAGELIAAAAESHERTLRAAAATAAGRLDDTALLERLRRDPEPAVRAAALAAFAEQETTEPLVAALDDPDPTVRATALDALAESEALPTARVAQMIDAARSDRGQNDVRRTGVDVLRKRAEKHPERDRQAVVEALRQLADDADWQIRRDAADALAALGEPRPAVGGVETRRDLEAYREVLRQTATPRRVELVTERGTLELELACPEAPMTCLSFLQLAAQGFFDGMLFHRVVPDFVVQGGDPRGDGWGGPGYSLRDEINRLRYVRGAVGMALSGPDTGGSQFFVTLSPQPHLDGGYTVFGRLVAGERVLDQIRQGDRLIRVRELPASEASGVR